MDSLIIDIDNYAWQECMFEGDQAAAVRSLILVPPRI